MQPLLALLLFCRLSCTSTLLLLLVELRLLLLLAQLEEQEVNSTAGVHLQNLQQGT
jgi:hypothetical protein